jgi:beta-1,4-galactosyltransferase 1
VRFCLIDFKNEGIYLLLSFFFRFLSKSSKTFHLYIVEQSNDQRRFNRGKLLNIGFHLAKTRYQQSQSQQPQGDGATTPGVPLSPPSVYVFHDVDLLPSNDLLPYYENVPAATSPVHIARVWNRYSNNLDYFGGIVSFSKDQFERINGFPNNFWGWGGEDDELIKRVKRVRLRSFSLSLTPSGQPDSDCAYLRFH